MAEAGTKVPSLVAEGSNVRKLRCRTVATGRLGHRSYIRELPPLGAEAADTSSLTDEASPSPCEALLAALGSCLSIGIHANAVARAIPIRHLEIGYRRRYRSWRTSGNRRSHASAAGL